MHYPNDEKARGKVSSPNRSKSSSWSHKSEVVTQSWRSSKCMSIDADSQSIATTIKDNNHHQRKKNQ